MDTLGVDPDHVQPGDPVQLTVDLGLPWPASVLAPASRTTLTLDFTMLDITPPRRLCWGENGFA